MVVRTQRQVVDYALQRRALLAQLHAGRVGVMEVCDADPYLLRAAKFHGEQTERPCPICRKEQLWEVSWVYGDDIGDCSGSARSTAQLEVLAKTYPDFAVHEVEVCRGCGWNHLVRSYRTGTPGTAPARRRRRGSS